MLPPVEVGADEVVDGGAHQHHHGTGHHLARIATQLPPGVVKSKVGGTPKMYIFT